MTEESSRRFVEASLGRAEKALKSAKLLEENGELEDAGYTIVTSFLAKP